MYIIYKRMRQKDDTGREIVIEADIVPDGKYNEWAQKARDLNSKSKSSVEYVILSVDDDSLTAFLARDRKYDMTKYDETAEEIRQQLNALNDSISRLDVFYREARNN